MKKFYTLVSTHEHKNGFTIHLDGRPMKTPAKHDFECPNEAIADLVQHEWSSQEDKIVPEAMPVTQMISTCIDRVIDNRDEIEQDIMGYLNSDLLFYKTEEPKDLGFRQDALFSPVLDFCAKKLGKLPQAVTDLSVPTIQQDTHQNWKDFLESLPHLHFTIFAHLTSISGSILLAKAFYDKQINTNEFIDIAFCDELFYVDLYNTKENGLDPQLEAKINMMTRDLDAISLMLDAMI